MLHIILMEMENIIWNTFYNVTEWAKKMVVTVWRRTLTWRVWGEEVLSEGPFLREGQIMWYCSFVRSSIYLLKNAWFTSAYRKVSEVFILFLRFLASTRDRYLFYRNTSFLVNKTSVRSKTIFYSIMLLCWNSS